MFRLSTALVDKRYFGINFAPVTLNTSTNEENLKIALLSYDDLEKDSPFSEMQYRLASGDYIKREKKGAVINANLANQNELKVGDTIELSTENGTKVSVQILEFSCPQEMRKKTSRQKLPPSIE